MLELEQWKLFVNGALYALAIFGIMVASFPAYILFISAIDMIVRVSTRAYYDVREKIKLDILIKLTAQNDKDKEQ
jgi:hypothetical protein